MPTLGQLATTRSVNTGPAQSMQWHVNIIAKQDEHYVLEPWRVRYQPLISDRASQSPCLFVGPTVRSAWRTIFSQKQKQKTVRHRRLLHQKTNVPRSSSRARTNCEKTRVVSVHRTGHRIAQRNTTRLSTVNRYFHKYERQGDSVRLNEHKSVSITQHLLFGGGVAQC